jgi:quercetin dioxygenase-like cupin family protein
LRSSASLPAPAATGTPNAVGQTLHVTEGVGLVGTRGGGVAHTRAGDTVVCPPDEEHWHGAAAGRFMSHLPMLENLPAGQDPTTWLEPVTAEQYDTANYQ